MKNMIDSRSLGTIMVILSIAVSLITIIIVTGVVALAILKDGSTTTSVIAAFTTVIGFVVSTAGFIIHAFMSNNSPSQISVPSSNLSAQVQVTHDSNNGSASTN